MTITNERRIERMRLAGEEAKALTAWKANGEQGARPDTPNLDEIEEEKSNPMAAAKTTPTRGPGRPKQVVLFAVDGEIQTHKTRGYTLGYLAYDHTAGLAKGDAKRLTTAEFKTALAKAGVADPTGSPWGPVTLGGKVFEAVLEGTKPQPVDKPKAAAATKKAATKRTAKKAPAAKKAAAKKPAKKLTAGRKRTASKATKAPAAKRALQSVPTGSKVVSRPEAR